MTESEPCCRDYLSVRDVLSKKLIQGVVSVTPETTVQDAADRMLSAGIGSLLVVEGARHIGIITERDMVRTVRSACDPKTHLVRTAMSTDLYCCSDEVSADEVAALMQVRRVRHMPVVDANEAIIGIVSIGDINAHRVGQCEVVLKSLEHYVYRRA